MDLHNLAFAQKLRMCIDEVAPEFSAVGGCNKAALKTSDSEVRVNGKSQTLCAAEFFKNWVSASHPGYPQIEHVLY